MNETPDPQQPENAQPQYGPPAQDPPYAQPQYAEPSQVPQYAQPQYAEPQYAQPQYAQPGQYPQTPYGATQPPKKGLSTGAIVGIVAGGVALILVLVGGLFAASSFFSPPTLDSGYAAPSKNNEGSAAEALEQYLNAIAEGDATTARDMLGETASNKLLSDEVLKKSLELAPMTNISIDRDSIQKDSLLFTVSASFDLGDETITRDFSVYDSYNDGWSIMDGLVDVSLSSFKGFDPSLNGVKAADDYVEVFPGTYEVTLDNDAFTVGGDSNAFTFADDSSYTRDENFEPVLTKEATKTFTKLVSDSLKECLKLTSLTTPCGNNVKADSADGSKLVDGEIKRTLTSTGEAKLKALEPRRDWETPTKVSALMLVDIDLSRIGDNAERSRWMYGGQLLTPSVDFADEKPSVTWE